MALTLTRNQAHKGIVGNQRWEALQVAFDSSYPTNGESGLTPAALGLDVIYLVLASPTSGYTFNFDYTNNLLLAYRIEVIASADSSGANNTLVKDTGTVVGVSGTGTAFGQALSEVVDTTDLSSLTGIHMMVFGH